MELDDFDYDLPPERIARYPSARRSDARLLVVPPGDAAFIDALVTSLPDRLSPGDVLVFNDTRVIPARLRGHKQDTGGAVEILIERCLDETRALAHIRASKSPPAGTVIELAPSGAFRVLDRNGELFEIAVEGGATLEDIMNESGEMPLPPYLGRGAEALDSERYQTLVAREPGAVAAPTAGLHFDETLLNAIDGRGVTRCCVTLHVGAGTFQPVRGDVADHVMHSETYAVDGETCDAINAARQRGNRVVAVGTTVARTLESIASEDGTIEPASGETSLFIKPGFRFRVIDQLLTNFHLPRSTLLMLVSAFAGYERVMAAYQHAVSAQYRFYSYGDAMLLSRADVAAENQ